MGFPGGSDGKESACNVGDLGSIPGLERSPGRGHGNPLQYSCLENLMERGAWWSTVHGVAESDMNEWLSTAAHIVIWLCLYLLWASLVPQMVKNLKQCRSGFDLWVRKIPWRRERLPVPVFLPGEFPGQRSLVDCSPRGHKKLDTVEQLTHNILYLLKRLSSISIG